MRDTITFNKEDWPYSDKSHGVFTGFFVPPRTGSYSFLIKNDDVGELYLSSSQSAANKVPALLLINVKALQSYLKSFISLF